MLSVNGERMSTMLREAIRTAHSPDCLVGYMALEEYQLHVPTGCSTSAVSTSSDEVELCWSTMNILQVHGCMHCCARGHRDICGESVSFDDKPCKEYSRISVTCQVIAIGRTGLTVRVASQVIAIRRTGLTIMIPPARLIRRALHVV